MDLFFIIVSLKNEIEYERMLKGDLIEVNSEGFV